MATAPVAHNAPAVPDNRSLVWAVGCTLLATGAWPTRGATNARPLLPATTHVPTMPAAVTRIGLDAFDMLSTALATKNSFNVRNV